MLPLSNDEAQCSDKLTRALATHLFLRAGKRHSVLKLQAPSFAPKMIYKRAPAYTLPVSGTNQQTIMAPSRNLLTQ